MGESLGVYSPKHEKSRSPLINGGNLPYPGLGHDGDELVGLAGLDGDLVRLLLYGVGQVEEVNKFVSPNFPFQFV